MELTHLPPRNSSNRMSWGYTGSSCMYVCMHWTEIRVYFTITHCIVLVFKVILNWLGSLFNSCPFQQDSRTLVSWTQKRQIKNNNANHTNIYFKKVCFRRLGLTVFRCLDTQLLAWSEQQYWSSIVHLPILSYSLLLFCFRPNMRWVTWHFVNQNDACMVLSKQFS